MPKSLTTYLQTGPDRDEPAFVLPVVNDVEQRAMEIFGPNKRLKVVMSLDSSADARTPRAYYWAVVLPAMAQGFIELGNEGTTPEDVHEYVKAFLMQDPQTKLPKYHPSRYIRHMDGQQVLAPCSTAAIVDDVSWWDFLGDLRKWAAEHLYISISDPIPARVRGEQTFPT
jgi:hypothetical protein